MAPTHEAAPLLSAVSDMLADADGLVQVDPRHVAALIRLEVGNWGVPISRETLYWDVQHALKDVQLFSPVFCEHVAKGFGL